MGALALLFKIKWSKQWNDVLFCLFALVDAISFTIFVYTTAAQLFRKLVTLKVKILHMVVNQRLLSPEVRHKKLSNIKKISDVHLHNGISMLYVGHRLLLKILWFNTNRRNISTKIFCPHIVPVQRHKN